MDKPNLGKQLIWGGAVYTGVVLFWPVFMVLSAPTGTLDVQLAAIAQAPGLYVLNFFIATLIAPALAVIMVHLALSLSERSLADIIGGLFFGLYVLLITVAYSSQWAFLPRLLAAGQMEVAHMWYFNNDLSLPYFLNQLGYGCFGVSAILIGRKYIFDPGVARLTGITLLVSGSLSVLALLALGLKLSLVNSVATIASGLFSIPLGVLAVLWGRQISKMGKSISQ